MGRASAYGLLALSTIASRRNHSRGTTARDIASTTGVPVEYLRKILQRLTRARIVRSERGRNGGYRLLHPAERITLLEVVEAIEGPIDASAILDGVPSGSARSPVSRRLRRWRREIAVRLREILRETSLHSISQENGATTRLRQTAASHRHR